MYFALAGLPRASHGLPPGRETRGPEEPPCLRHGKRSNYPTPQSIDAKKKKKEELQRKKKHVHQRQAKKRRNLSLLQSPMHIR